MIFLPNRGTDMMCQNNFGGKMIISLMENYIYIVSFLKGNKSI